MKNSVVSSFDTLVSKSHGFIKKHLRQSIIMCFLYVSRSHIMYGKPHQNFFSMNHHLMIINPNTYFLFSRNFKMQTITYYKKYKLLTFLEMNIWDDPTDMSKKWTKFDHYLLW